MIVVGAALVREGRVLAARRSCPAELAGRWEFPGGKREPGETDTDALVRECAEELGVRIEVGESIGVAPVTVDVELRVYLATIVCGEPRLIQDHDELRWLGADELDTVDWLPADVGLLPALRHIL